ncbi:AI-2E family transporter [Zobellia sp. 1_MG-2023]|uniref:AI-2E family transporter n=1 Tax=Zobellia sp. 1_MG-2023 TaxID=3062626 RepID=UPI0026E36D03|nr:AI-2E family transporter [Zobellia sp. 1_MG-2023]MDO6817556.1 AI-2E family transporter [Zobellia sp. 1_MG-2023]
MKSTEIANGILKAIAAVCGIVLLLYIIYELQSIVAYLIISAIVALIGRPIVTLLRKNLRIPNILAVAMTMLVIAALFGGIIMLIVPLLTEQGKNLYLFDFGIIQNEFDKLYVMLSEYFGTTKKVVEDLVEDATLNKTAVNGLGRDLVPSFIKSILQVLDNIGIGLFSVLFISFFFLKDSNIIQRSILTSVPDSHRMKTMRSLAKIKNLLSRYFVGLLFQIFILFSLYAITLILVGVENAVLIAFMCALFNIIPYLGPMIGAVIMVMFTITSHPGVDFSTIILPKVGYVLLGVTIGQLIDNFFSQPIIFSNSVKSHPLEIFLVILGAGLLFGIVGMMLAVPGYTVLKVILKQFVSKNKIVTALTKGL